MLHPDRRSHSLLPLLVLLPLALVAGVILYLRTPPAITRLLPEADAVAYADLRPIRLATHLDRNLPPRSPEYQHFVDSTGIVPERDLDQAAFALTARPDPSGPNGPVAWTEILAGHFDTSRLEQYLRSLQPTTELYDGHTLFVLTTSPATPPTPTTPGFPARQLRVTIVRPGLLALSNAPTPEQIHLILDHSRSSLLLPGPSVLAAHFPSVPHLSFAWAVGRVALPFSDFPPPTSGSATTVGHLSLFGLDLPIPSDQPMVVSLRYLGSLRLRAELLTPSADIALQQAGSLSSLLAVARTLATAQTTTAPSPLRQTLDSIRVAPDHTRDIVTAVIPLALLRDLTASSVSSK